MTWHNDRSDKREGRGGGGDRQAGCTGVVGREEEGGRQTYDGMWWWMIW